VTDFRQIAPFGALAVGAGVSVVALPAAVGELTAFHVKPSGLARGKVLIVPGFTGSKEDFRTFVPLLAERGFEVFAYSQRGQADSAAPVGVENYALADLARDAIDVAGLVGDGQPVHLLGHSFGGCVARAAAIAQPAVFRSLTLLCSGPNGWPGRHQDTTDAVAAGGSIGLWYRDNPDTLGVSDADLDPELAFLRLRAERTSSDNLLAAADILRNDPDTTEELRQARIPTLVAHGEHDDKWPIDWQRDMAERLGARYAVIPGGAHSPQVEAPEVTADALADFWGAHAAA
jgi:pimeloyl-ACP methyl ester carboxylesterase